MGKAIDKAATCNHKFPEIEKMHCFICSNCRTVIRYKTLSIDFAAKRRG